MLEYIVGAAIDVKSKDRHSVVCGAYSKLKFWKGNYHLESMMLVYSRMRIYAKL